MQFTGSRRNYQASYPLLCKDLAGQAMSLDQWNRNQAQINLMVDQSHRIARKLEDEGIRAYDEDQDLTLFGLNTRQYKVLDNFRNISFIPLVAKKQRASILKLLSYWLQKYTFDRMWTITTGTRCSIYDVEDRTRELHRKVSKINDKSWMKQAGASFIFRSTEFGEVVETDEGLSLHPHCHAVLHLDKGRLSPAHWSFLLHRIQEYFGVHCQDNGRIREPREFVKYCVKPSDLEQLSGPALAELQRITSRLRLVEKLRGLRLLAREIREADQKLVRRKGIIVRRKSWNKGATMEDVPRYLRPLKDEGDPVASPFVVAWCAPAPVFAPVSEPLFIVHGLRGQDPSAVFSWLDVVAMRNAINVHTKALTVPVKGEQERGKPQIIYESEPKIPQRNTGTVGVR